jgi:hypothetical protein
LSGPNLPFSLSLCEARVDEVQAGNRAIRQLIWCLQPWNARILGLLGCEWGSSSEAAGLEKDGGGRESFHVEDGCMALLALGYIYIAFIYEYTYWLLLLLCFNLWKMCFYLDVDDVVLVVDDCSCFCKFDAV